MTPSKASLGAVVFGLWACRSAPPAPPITRLSVRLHAPLDAIPPAQPDTPRNSVMERAVELPDGPWMEHATLRVEGLTGRAMVSVDDAPPVELIGGPGYAELPLPGLTAGLHQFRVESSAAPDLSPVLIGGDGPRSPSLLDPPVLLLRPAAHVTALAFPVVDGRVAGRARVEGAPDGAVLHFVITRDGEVLQDLGRAPCGSRQRVHVAYPPWACTGSTRTRSTASRCMPMTWSPTRPTARRGWAAR
jgi:hypothetical protein